MYELEFDYIKALYRRNNNDEPCVWCAVNEYFSNCYTIYYGILGKTIIKGNCFTSRNVDEAIKSDINSKRKKGYKYISELKDNCELPRKEALIEYLNTYLPYNRTTEDGSFLPMLAKKYDNQNNKIFNKCSSYYGQYKINGLRCSIRPYINYGGLFEEIDFDIQSREGVHWNGLVNLKEYLKIAIPKGFLITMIDNNWALDGEIYLPNYSVNEINHFVKDITCKEHNYLQYWCYDLIADDIPQSVRFDILGNALNKYCKQFTTKEEHLSNTNNFVVLPLVYIHEDIGAITARDEFISRGFEGLILRDPSAYYQFGKRNSSMIKFKKSTDGKFIIKDVVPEGIKRPDIPLFICKNDINDELFECHVGGSLDYQKECLKNKYDYINKYMYVEYGERSGINQVPFHIKTTYIL